MEHVDWKKDGCALGRDKELVDLNSCANAQEKRPCSGSTAAIRSLLDGGLRVACISASVVPGFSSDIPLFLAGDARSRKSLAPILLVRRYAV